MPIMAARGNGLVEVGEDCDDADGCDAACTFESPEGTDDGGTGDDAGRAMSVADSATGAGRGSWP